ncbi:MAG: agmatine deiminase family protein [Nitrospinota bacterium]|nr:agmatine deiminase family protein [Nitrospinota bacterium]
MSIKKNHITPSSLKYRMPAEWEEHEAIWLSWPHDSTDYPNGLDKVQETYIQIIKAISIFERVKLCVKDNGLINKVKGLLRKENVELGNIVFHVINYNDIWIRDYGPIFIVNQNEKKLAMTHWIFNAWGDKYVELKNDTIIPSIINQSMKIPCFTPGIVLEGGSIDVNGKGTLITTKQCLLNERRNPNLSGKEIEFCLMEFLGVEKIIWLNEGIAGDDTDGHIDDIARFVNPTTLLCAYENDKDDENHDILKNNYEILKKSTDQNGNKFTIIKLPMPGFVGDKKARLPATYTNFYIGNNVVLVPVFGHKNDQFAMDIIQDCFPTRKIVGIDCLELVHGLGTIHCISQQQPAIPEKTL